MAGRAVQFSAVAPPLSSYHRVKELTSQRFTNVFSFVEKNARDLIFMGMIQEDLSWWFDGTAISYELLFCTCFGHIAFLAGGGRS